MPEPERTTLATLQDCQSAGNLNKRIDEAVILFYLDLASGFMEELLSPEVYALALTTSHTGYTDKEVSRMVKAEALTTVAFCLPALAMVTAIQGVARTTSMGGGGYIEYLSYTKEITELANSFLSMAQQLIGIYVSSSVFTTVWSNVVMNMFPSMSEMPTVADIGSDYERLIQIARGDVPYTSSMG